MALRCVQRPGLIVNSRYAKLDACRHIFLAKLGTGPSLDLRIFVVEARVQDELVSVGAGDRDLDAIFAEAHPIMTKEGYDAFTIIFESYVCFSVRNETYAIPEDDEDYRAAYVRTNNPLFWILCRRALGRRRTIQDHSCIMQ
jgi:hypothetical protein